MGCIQNAQRHRRFAVVYIIYGFVYFPFHVHTASAIMVLPKCMCVLGYCMFTCVRAQTTPQGRTLDY